MLEAPLPTMLSFSSSVTSTPSSRLRYKSSSSSAPNTSSAAMAHAASSAMAEPLLPLLLLLHRTDSPRAAKTWRCAPASAALRAPSANAARDGEPAGGMSLSASAMSWQAAALLSRLTRWRSSAASSSASLPSPPASHTESVALLVLNDARELCRRRCRSHSDCRWRERRSDLACHAACCTCSSEARGLATPLASVRAACVCSAGTCNSVPHALCLVVRPSAGRESVPHSSADLPRTCEALLCTGELGSRVPGMALDVPADRLHSAWG
mmetsp:Transcript_29766/g.88104  ORF Transcript_29766/g.88104 Transcript_29766/m.88104 type:complete len:268 (+) Transcript_29766:2236-3039(+)